MRARASRRPTLTTHSRRIDASIRVNRMIGGADVPGACEHQLLQRLARDIGDDRLGQHLDRVIGDVEEHVLKVDGVARDADSAMIWREPVARELLAKGKALDQDGALGGNDRPREPDSCRHRARRIRMRKGKHGLAVLVRKPNEHQVAQESRSRGWLVMMSWLHAS